MKHIGVSGHQSIPQEALAFIEEALRGITELYPTATGISSLAAGADQLFAETILRAGGRLHVVIPCKDYETTFSSKSDLRSFYSLLKRATSCEELPYEKPSEEAFLAAGQHIADISEILLAIWDGQPAKGKGGTADIVNYARAKGLEVVVVWPAGIMR